MKIFFSFIKGISAVSMVNSSISIIYGGLIWKQNTTNEAKMLNNLFF